MPVRSLLLASSTFFLISPPADAQQSAPPEPAAEAQTEPADTAAPAADEFGEEDEGIVITGQRARGSVVGDIPPERTYDSRDVRATGATNINELLDAIAPEIGSARGRSGGRPVTLLNGQRISSFRELRDIPTEAISRVEILPEEVALKYGYSADQRVVNIVLRRRFNSTNVEARGQVATDGGYLNGRAEVGRLIIAEGTRTSISFKAEGNSALFEDERDIALQPVESQPDPVDPRPFRTLVGSGNDFRLTAMHNRTILGDVSHPRAQPFGEREREPAVVPLRSLCCGFPATLLSKLKSMLGGHEILPGLDRQSWDECHRRRATQAIVDLERGTQPRAVFDACHVVVLKMFWKG